MNNLCPKFQKLNTSEIWGIYGKEEENGTLRKEKLELEEQMGELNAKIIGLEEENIALREQYQRIIKAIDQKYGEYEETCRKRM